MLEKCISIYIHFPWCVRKCYYCDFNSYGLLSNNNKEQIKQYITKLLLDFDHSVQHLPTNVFYKIRSIFFGGGTPSLLSGNNIANILDQINQRFNFSNDLEITLEVNPGTIERDSMLNYRAAGVNRISLGIQTLQERQLQLLGRIHNSLEAKAAIASLIKAKFENFNIDLMYALPEQTKEQAIDDLTTILSFMPTHISWYQLTIEPNTIFYQQPPPCPDHDAAWEIYQHGLELLHQHGYINYEISAFAKQHYYCKHNLNYWQYGDFLGIGAGAHSKLSYYHFVDQWPKIKHINRMIKVKTPKKYLNTLVPNLTVSNQMLSEQDIIFEFILNNLRLYQGFSVAHFEQSTGLKFSKLQDPLHQAIEQNLIYMVDNIIKPTTLGHRFLNNLLELFIVQ